ASNGRSVAYRYAGDELIEATRGERTTRYGYVAGRLSRIDEAEGTVALEYDSGGRVVSRRFGDGSRERYDYDDTARRVRITDAAGAVTMLQWSADGRREQLTDPLGHTSTVESDELGRTLRATGPTGRSVRFSYDRLGRIAAIESGDGRTNRFEYYGDTSYVVAIAASDGSRQTFEYDADMNLTAMRNGVHPLVRMTYHADGRVESVAEGSAGPRRIGYDNAGRIVAITDPSGNSFRYDYDSHGRTTRITNPLGGVTTRAYDAGDRLVAVTAPDGATTRHQYDSAGRLSAVVDASGATTRFGYDHLGRLVTVTDPAARVSRYSYDAAGRLVRRTPPEGGADSYTYDAAGNLVELTDARGRTARIEYDPAGRRVAERWRHGPAIAYRHDALGQLLGWQDDLGAGQTFEYDARGRVTVVRRGEAIVRYAYDELDRLTAVTDPLQQVKRIAYGPDGRIAAVTAPDGSIARYTYDAAGRLSTVNIPGGGLTRLELDPMGNLVRSTDPAGRAARYVYDAAGRMISATDANGHTTMYAYDGAGRVIGKRLADGRTVRYQFDATGRLLRADDGKYPVEYGYDAQGRLERISHPALRRTLRYEYLPTGQRSRLVDSEGRSVTFEYDAAQRLRAIRADGGSIELEHDARDRLTSLRYPNGTVARWEYDAQGRLLRVSHSGADGRALAEWRHDYDAAGNRVRTADSNGRVSEYRYDAAGQLAEERTASGVVRYEYLPGGNRVRRVASEDARYRYDDSGRLLQAGDETFAYDANGNVVERRGPRGVTRYRYDVENQLVQIVRPDGSDVSFGYSATGDRVWRRDAAGITYFVHDGYHLVAELAEDLTAKANYLHAPGIDRPLSMRRAGRSFFYHADALGSIVALTDERGQLAAAYDYSAFGEMVPGNPRGLPNPFTFTAREWDDTVGLYFFRSRYYDPKLGRFLTPDPMSGDRLDPLSLNVYAYAMNNPLRYVDPFGTQRLDPLGDFPASGVGPMDALDPLKPPVLDGRSNARGDYGTYSPRRGAHIYSDMPNMRDVDWQQGVREHELHHWKQWQLSPNRAEWALDMQRRGIDPVSSAGRAAEQAKFHSWANANRLPLERGAYWQQAHHLVRDRGLSPDHPAVKAVINGYKQFGGGDPSKLQRSLDQLAGKPWLRDLSPQEIFRALGPSIALAQFVSCLDLNKSYATCAVEGGVSWAVAEAIGAAAAKLGLTGPQAIFVAGALGWASVGLEGWRQVRDAREREAAEKANQANQEALAARVDELRKQLDALIPPIERLRSEASSLRNDAIGHARRVGPHADSARELLDSLRDLRNAAQPHGRACAQANELRGEIAKLVTSALEKAKEVTEKINEADAQVANCQTQQDVDSIGWLLQRAQTLAGEAIALSARAEGLNNRLNQLDPSSELDRVGAHAAALVAAIDAKVAEATGAAASAKAAAAAFETKAAELLSSKNSALKLVAAFRDAFPPRFQPRFEEYFGRITAAASLSADELGPTLLERADQDASRAEGYARTANGDLSTDLRTWAACKVQRADDLIQQAREARTDALVFAGGETQSKLQACRVQLQASSGAGPAGGPVASGPDAGGGPGSGGADSGTSPVRTLMMLSVQCQPSPAKVGDAVTCTASGAWSDNPFQVVDLTAGDWSIGPSFIAAAPGPVAVAVTRAGLHDSTTVLVQDRPVEPVATGRPPSQGGAGAPTGTRSTP
ncbi:MAG TPA: RHS repeat-associated core domain-containing protein, partial [Burkholderiaceae bacterium]|nr:RHS repeat-associated core domain-containing protein [Burkholderiaceae bacterium]